MRIDVNIIFTLYFADFVVGYLEFENYKLEQLQLLFRHGDRIPDKREIFPNDPNDEVYRGYGYGQLTKIGKQRMYKVGQMLRNRYDSFLGEYRSNEVYAYSSDADRTKMSLQLVLAGLYPPSPSTSWSDSINWQPIPTYYEALNVSFLTAPSLSPMLQRLHKESENTTEFLNLFKKYQIFYQRVEDNTGLNMSKLFSGWPVYTNLRSALSLDLTLPAWCSKEDYQELEKIATLAIKAMTRTDRLTKITAGLIVEQFLKALEDTTNPKKVYLYSGHDVNIAPFIHSHKFTGVPDYPDYGSTIIMEKLRGTNNRSYIRMYLWTGVTEELISLKLPTCDLTCPLSNYVNIAKSIITSGSSRIYSYGVWKNVLLIGIIVVILFVYCV